MGLHRLLVDEGTSSAWAAGERVVVDGEEAEHAVRVKRVRVGEQVELMDGRGTVARGVVRAVQTGRSPALEVGVEAVERVAPVRPRVEVWSATPKGGRVEELVDGLSQVGAALWRPLRTERGVVQPREAKVARLERVAREAAKQSGRAWVMEIGKEGTFAEGLSEGLTGTGPERVEVIVADAAGEVYAARGAPALDAVRLLIGPEGGWSDEERAQGAAAGARLARFGVHVMRIETAAVVAAGMMIGMARG